MHEDAIDRVVAKASVGDRAALGDIYDMYSARLYRYLVLHVRDASDTEDLLQRIFLKVIEGLPRYEARGVPFGAWVFRIARNAVIDFNRTRRDHASLDDVLERPDERRGPAELVETAVEQEAIRSALDELTADQREVIIYRFFAGLSHGEIGLLMDKSEGSVRALQFRAMQTLRGSLAPQVELLRAPGVGS